MEWIRINESIELPVGYRVFLREYYSPYTIYYKAGTMLDDDMVKIDDINSIEHLHTFTHYSLIIPPKD